MKLIVGLGNPGEKYRYTRHNVGFMALDVLLEKLEPLKNTFLNEDKNLKSEIKNIKLNGNTLLLAKPTTFMNNSGFAVSKILNYYKISPEDLMVIHDDLDLPLGKIKVRFGGSAGGHKGVESIINVLGTDKFLRVRLGIGATERNQKPRTKPQEHVERYVLGSITSSERGKVKTCLRETVRTVELIIKHGLEKYMSRYNSK